ncbi:glycosyltransferase [Miniphocaeibacter massiliensis]|uniref:glycosyltransferase n=1 Tax=Miniphocaeibacter massiliensis TaxID=2041841 RepID=UPI000C1BE08E|nr:glycosyltransferase [Miniphocaeibacter massiliensis]
MEKIMSIIIPAFNEESNVELIHKKINEIMMLNGINYEIIFVDDGSKDKTWENIEKISKDNVNIKGIKFSRNFGKEAAVFAGLKESKGNCCSVIDSDLQHPPETLVEMYRLWEDGYDVIEGIKLDRGKENKLYKNFSKLFYKLMSSATKIDMEKTSDFKLLDRKAVDAIIELPEKNMFFRAMSAWVGFKTVTIGYEVQERAHGESKWSTMSLIKYAITNIVSFTTAPLHIVTFLGTIFFVFTIIFGIHSLYNYFTHQALGGFTTIILLQLIIGSIVMLSLGIIGTYIGAIYDEVKDRNRYIVEKFINI